MLDIVSGFIQEANGDGDKLAELILQYAEDANRDSRFRYEYTALEFCDVIEIEKLDELGQVGWDIVQILSNRRSAVSRKVYIEDVIMYTVIMKRQYQYNLPESQDE
jgi:hypothetical protein